MSNRAVVMSPNSLNGSSKNLPSRSPPKCARFIEKKIASMLRALHARCHRPPHQSTLFQPRKFRQNVRIRILCAKFGGWPGPGNWPVWGQVKERLFEVDGVERWV